MSPVEFEALVTVREVVEKLREGIPKSKGHPAKSWPDAAEFIEEVFSLDGEGQK